MQPRLSAKFWTCTFNTLFRRSVGRFWDLPTPELWWGCRCHSNCLTRQLLLCGDRLRRRAWESPLEQHEALFLNTCISNSHLVISQIKRKTPLPFSLWCETAWIMFPLAIYLCSKEEPETCVAWAPFLLERERCLMFSRSLGLSFS